MKKAHRDLEMHKDYMKGITEILGILHDGNRLRAAAEDVIDNCQNSITESNSCVSATGTHNPAMGNMEKRTSCK
jgi:hypothetical protein